MRQFWQRLRRKLFGPPIYEVRDVYTPTVCAFSNYISRPRQESLFNNSLSTPGTQLIVYGHSGSGKTTLVRYLLQQNNYKSITTRCCTDTTFDDIILSGFDQLDSFVVVEKSHRSGTNIKTSLSAEYNSIKADVQSTHKIEDSENSQRILPPQLTGERLANMMGKCQVIWVIEDFHKVELPVKNSLADLLKIFVDNANDYKESKIICIGACDSAQELVKLNPDISTRVCQLFVPMLNPEEIKQIVRNGCSLLNINMEQSLVDKIIYYSGRIGAHAHHMCLDICLNNNISKTQKEEIFLTDNQFNHAVNGFLNRNNDTLQVIYDTAVANELGWYVLKTFSSNSHEKLSTSEIEKRVNFSGKGFSKEEIQSKLDELSNEQFKVLYRHTASGYYSISSPFWRAFLRMQFALEASAQENAKMNRNNHKKLRLTAIDQNSKDAVVDKMILDMLEKMCKLRGLDFKYDFR